MLNYLMNTEMIKKVNNPLTNKMLEMKTRLDVDKEMYFYNIKSKMMLYIGSLKEGNNVRHWSLIPKNHEKSDFFSKVATYQPTFAQLFKFLKAEAKELKYSPVEEWARLCKAWLFSNYSSEEIDMDFSDYYKCVLYGNTNTPTSNDRFRMLIPSLKANILVPITNVNLLKPVHCSEVTTNLANLIEDYGISFNGADFVHLETLPQLPIKFGNGKSLFIGGDNDFIAFLSPSKEMKRCLDEQLKGDSFYQYIGEDIQIEVNGQTYYYTYAITLNYSNYLFDLSCPDILDESMMVLK